MNTPTVQQWLHEHPQRILSTAEIARARGESVEFTHGLLASCRDPLPLFHVGDRWVNPWTTDNPETIVPLFYPDGYVSLEWALARWGCLSQQPTVLSVVTPSAVPHDPQAVTGRWSLECLSPLSNRYPAPILTAENVPVATAAHALIDWAYHRWLQPGASLSLLQSFLDDCDRDVVDDDLIVLQQHADPLIRQLADTIIRQWPDESHVFVASANTTRQP